MGIIAENFDTIEGDIEVGVERLVGTIKIGGTVYNRYVKVVDCGALTNNTTKTVAHGISLVGLLSIKGISLNPTNGTTIPLPYVGTGGINYMVSMFVNLSNIYITPQSDYTGYTKTYVTLEYYK